MSARNIALDARNDHFRFLGLAATLRRAGRAYAAKEGKPLQMFLVLAVLLVLTWLLGLIFLKVASVLVHLFLLFAILFGVFHFMRG